MVGRLFWDLDLATETFVLVNFFGLVLPLPPVSKCVVVVLAEILKLAAVAVTG